MNSCGIYGAPGDHAVVTIAATQPIGRIVVGRSHNLTFGDSAVNIEVHDLMVEQSLVRVQPVSNFPSLYGDIREEGLYAKRKAVQTSGSGSSNPNPRGRMRMYSAPSMYAHPLR